MADNYGTDIYNSAGYPGGGLSAYTSSAPPYANLGYSRSPNELNSIGKKLDPIGIGRMFGLNKLFGDKKTPKTPRWQRLANEEWAQGNAALSAYSQLYEPTLNLARRSAADYGDLYRRAANDQLAFEIRSSTTKRDADLQDFQRLGGDYVAAARGSNPLLGDIYDSARSEFALGGQLSPEMEAELEQYVRKGQAGRGMGLGPADVYQEALGKTTFGEQLRRRRLEDAYGAAGLYGDIFQATTGRPVRSPSPAGANIQAPQQGTAMDDFFSYGVNKDMQRININAAEKASDKAMTGQIIGGLLSSAGGFAGLCWVAREVFGEENPSWVLFRHWLTTKAPESLRDLYARNGEKLAAKLKQMPNLKPAIRAFMEEKIADLSAQPV